MTGVQTCALPILVTWSVTVATPHAAVRAVTMHEGVAPAGPRGHRPVWDPSRAETLPHALHRRAELAPGAPVIGPALIEEDETTTVVPPGWRARCDDAGHLVLDVMPEGEPAEPGQVEGTM